MKYLRRPYVQVVTREDWGASPPRKPPEPLRLPVGMLMLFDTQTQECTKTEDCKRLVKHLQDDYMFYRGYEDIPWNFLIGADGKVYEGRGWKVKPFKNNLENKIQAEWDGRSLDVAYIGDYRKKLPENVLSDQTLILVRLLRELNCIDSKKLQVISCMVADA